MLAVDELAWVMCLTAPVVGAVYFVVSRVVGDRFPFSRYAMYASTAMRLEGGVPLFRADGRDARIDDFVDFVGIDPAAIYPAGIPCSLEWRVREWQRWLSAHRSDVAGVEGPIRIQIGFRMLRVDEAGKLHQSIRFTQAGSAWPR